MRATAATKLLSLLSLSPLILRQNSEELELLNCACYLTKCVLRCFPDRSMLSFHSRDLQKMSVCAYEVGLKD